MNKEPTPDPVNALGDEMEEQFAQGYRGLSKLVMPFAIYCAKHGMTANMVTAIRVLFCVPFGIAMVYQWYVPAFFIYVFGMVLDFFDGRVARAMEDIGIERTEADRDNGAYFDSMGDKVYWIITTLIITFFLNLDKYITMSVHDVLLFCVAFLVFAELVLGTVRYMDYTDNQLGIPRNLRAGISGKLKMTFEGVATGALVAYKIPFASYSWIHTDISAGIHQALLWIGITSLFAAIPFAYRSYRLKRPR